MEKSQKLSTRWKITENSIFATQKTNSINKSVIVMICQCSIGRPTYLDDLCTFRHYFPQKMLRKIPENGENYNHGKSQNLTI